PGVPASFKVLVKELQSLGLDIKVLDKNNNEINLRDYSDDSDSDTDERKFSEEELGANVMDSMDSMMYDDEEGVEHTDDEDELDDEAELYDDSIQDSDYSDDIDE
ncbi:MAG: hypothetical protein J6T77_02990, partial [Clostridia bacterium]|nr:hypothetical protein [Clostridia bacterium]